MAEKWKKYLMGSGVSRKVLFGQNGSLTTTKSRWRLYVALLLWVAGFSVVQYRNVYQTGLTHVENHLDLLYGKEHLEIYPYDTQPVTADDVQCTFWNSVQHGYQPCSYMVRNDDIGYCLVRRTKDNRLFKVMETSPGTFYQRKEFACADVYLDFMNFRIGANRVALESRNRLVRAHASTKTRRPTRGIVMAAYTSILPSTAAAVMQLRYTGCQLPVEVWSMKGEISESSELVAELKSKYNVSFRVLDDPSVSGFMVKIYAVANSGFDRLLFLDSDNFAVRDPTYLFDTEEFERSGALFWPDHWHPAHSIFDTGPGGLAWELFGIDYKYEMEQESGQLLVDKRIGSNALTLMKYYVQSFQIVEKLKAVWGDKDLFRFAYRGTGTPFAMIQTLPALVGRYVAINQTNLSSMDFCGQTMLQHGPRGEALFLHRNTLKLSLERGKRMVWEKVQRFKGKDSHDYKVTIGPERQEDTCWYIADWGLGQGENAPTESASVEDSESAHVQIERMLIENVKRAEKLLVSEVAKTVKNVQ
ncbi:hypothetical protein NDN08_006012 [Rhodosorus marinus]|uniref:Nucleotide-diphospho-sugar transferase domain-containing protein n=1 Tax=Rhodosorus marinus TaxID=101924 RepID=A0AAV8UNG5_9RHOD|nr:hypothetical protein NDN08_006012 [Rhodosorus marinus]